MINFVVNSSTLHGVLKSVARNLVSKPMLPIMGKLKMTVHRGWLSVTATDDECWSKYSILLQGNDIFDGEGSFCIDTVLMSLLRELPEQPVQMCVGNDLKITVKYQGGHADMPVDSADEYPPIPPVDGNTFTLDALQLYQTLNQCLFAVSAGDTLRPVMSGVCLDFADGFMTVVATTGYLLYRKRCPQAVSEKCSIILPYKSAVLLSAMLERAVKQRSEDNAEPSVSLVCNSRNVQFSVNQNLIFSKLIQGRFPNYNNVIPSSQPYRATVQRDLFLGLLKRVMGSFAESVKLRFSGPKLVAQSVSDLSSSVCREEMSCTWDGPDDFCIAFKANFLVDILNHLYTPEVEMTLESPAKACVFYEKNGSEDVLMLLMPIQITD